MRKVIFWATIAAGATAAYLMFKRGESFTDIASKATQNPFSTLIDEITRA